MELHRITPLPILALAFAGCIAAEPENEGAAAGDNVAGKTVTLVANQTLGWPKDTGTYSGSVVVLQQDEREYKAAGELLVFPRVWNQIDIEVDQSMMQWFSTNIAFTVLHRDRNAANAAWQSLRCGDEYSWEHAQNGFRFFNDQTTIDVSAGKVSTREGVRSLSECGVNEANPEFAVFALPWGNVGNMRDPYGYSLWASCDGEKCENTASYGQAVFADNPAAQSAPASPSPSSAQPTPGNILAGQETGQATLTTYYQAISDGDLAKVESLWTGLNDSTRARLREIAQNGRGYEWAIEFGAETRDGSGYQATLNVVVRADKGETSYKWRGTIKVIWAPSIQDPMRWGWFITGMRLTQM